jgi:hypothetical protein
MAPPWVASEPRRLEDTPADPVSGFLHNRADLVPEELRPTFQIDPITG